MEFSPGHRESPQRVVSSERAMVADRLSTLASDLKVHILRDMPVRGLLACLSTSTSWWSAADAPLWRGLATQLRVVLPSRPRSSEKAMFLAAMRHQAELRLNVLYELRSSIWGGDAVAKMRSRLDADPALDASTPLPLFANATLLHLAARRGRLGCVRELVERGANIDAVDDGMLTPLAGAAWAGHKPIVEFLCAAGARLDIAGVPPMTSVCGGKEPMTAEAWAARKARYYQSLCGPDQSSHPPAQREMRLYSSISKHLQHAAGTVAGKSKNRLGLA